MAKRGRRSLEELGLISEEIIRELYENQSLSVSTAASRIGEHGISAGAFKRYMEKYGVKSRSRGNRRSKNTGTPAQSESFGSQVTGEVGFEGV